MSQEPDQIPSYKEWKSKPLTKKLATLWITFTDTTWKEFEEKFKNKIKRIDLWLIPPLAFIGCYNALWKIMPENHPMSMTTVLASAFMCMTLCLFIIRPKKLIRSGNEEIKRI